MRKDNSIGPFSCAYDPYMTLKSTYDKIKEQWKGDPHCLESYETVKAVQAHREYWKPKEVRLVLLAESHVFTSDKERKSTHIDLNKIDHEISLKLAGIPTDFVRFIYCLGCGENELLDENIEKNSGSPQFWKIFQACIDGPDAFHKILKKNVRDFQRRVENKVTLLFLMKERGIWLLDTSVVALYPKENNQSNLRMAINTSFDEFVEPLLKNMDNPKVIIIGKGVDKLVGQKCLNVIDVISQPNAHPSKKENQINFNKYHRLCSHLES